MKGSTWLKVGLILSVIWLPGFGWFVWTSLETEHQNAYEGGLKLCKLSLQVDNLGVTALNPPPPKEERDKALAANQAQYQKCLDDAKSGFLASDYKKTLMRFVAGIDTVTLLIGWLIGWLVFLVLRRIMRANVPA